MRAIRERGLAGEGPVHAERRSNALQKEERDPRRIIEGWGQLTIEVAPRVMPILQLVAAGGGERRRDGAPAARAGSRPADADATQRAKARRAGHLRAGMRPSEAADLLWACSSPELYDLLVTPPWLGATRYARFIVDVMIAGLLPRVE